jgi:hypothetical protein
MTMTDASFAVAALGALVIPSEVAASAPAPTSAPRAVAELPGLRPVCAGYWLGADVSAGQRPIAE